MRNSETQSGRSMVEILGVLAIIGVLSVGGILYYRYSLEKNKINTALNNAMHLAINTMSFFKEKDLQEHVGELDESNVEKPWNVSEHAKRFGYLTDGQNPWNKGSEVEVYLNKENKVVSIPTVEIYFKDVPEFACQRIGFQNTNDLVYVAVVDENGNEVVTTLGNTPNEFIEKCKALTNP